MLKVVIALLLVTIGSPAFAECASGYNQNAAPICAQIPSCASSSATTDQMGVLEPCSPNVVTANQLSSPALIDIGITDANAAVAAGGVPVMVKAPGLVNVEVWTHGSMATRLTQGPGSSGIFTGILNLSSEPAGPLHVMFFARDVLPGNTATIQLQGEYTLFVAGTRPSIPTPAPATGMTLVFSDHFTSLSATPCQPGTGTWPSCTAPTASSGFTWYENLYNGQDFGDCANEHTDGSFNPFTILPSGGLRIRNTYDASYVDPYGFGRTQYCGVLSSGFPGGSTTMPATDGYYDARVLVPNAACGASGNNTCSGGTWPSFWMLATNGSGTIGNIELDEMEEYGNAPAYFQGFTHAYSPAFYPASGGGGYAGSPKGDLTWDWHTVGMLVTGSATAGGTVCNYLDEVQLECSPMSQFGSPGSSTKPTWSVMLELASGGGWVENPPLSKQYDLFVDWVGVWH